MSRSITFANNWPPLWAERLSTRLRWLEGSRLRVNLILCLCLPLAGHLCFSWAGYNPTDDGFILAGSRRILEGQVPHRDFISVRPPGSYLVHLPFVLWGGEFTYWLSRAFVCLQFALIARAWAILAAKYLDVLRSPREQILLTLIVFSLGLHHFPIMAWHSLDAVFFSTMGILLATNPRPGLQVAGYALLGFAPLCRQNFLPVLPAALLLLGGWRRPVLWLATGAPMAAFLCILCLLGALPDFIQQMTAPTQLASEGFRPQLLSWWVLPGIIWALALAVIERRPRRRFRWTGLMICAPVLATAAALAVSVRCFEAASFVLLGLVAGLALLSHGSLGGAGRAPLGLPVLVVVLSWCVSISYGLNSPELMVGGLTAMALAYAWAAECDRSGHLPNNDRPPIPILARPVAVLFSLAVLSVAALGWARCTHIYRDVAGWQLRYPLANVLPGGQLLRSNVNTCGFLADIRAIEAQITTQEMAILPDVAGYWVQSARTNPLPVDWPLERELPSPELVQRVVDRLEANRGRITILVQRVLAAKLGRELRPVPDEGYSPIVSYVRSHFSQTGQTRYFDLYR